MGKERAETGEGCRSSMACLQLSGVQTVSRGFVFVVVARGEWDVVRG